MELVLESISKKYGKKSVLEDLSLTFPSGQLTAMLGPSGCGKTTILNIISGLLAPDGGKVLFDGRVMNGVPLAKRNVGYVFQDYSLYPTMTAYENICFPLTCKLLPEMKPMDRRQRRQFMEGEVHRLAKLLQLEPVLEQLPSELSGGQQQRVALARALIRRPDLLLMDEPFANLDRRLAVQMREEVRELQAKTGITTVFVTHNQEDANAIAGSIILMDHGQIQQQGSAETFYDRPANLFVADFFGEYGANVLTLPQALEGLSGAAAAAPPGARYLSVRPEELRLREGDCFRVISVRRISAGWLCRLRREELTLCVLLPAPIPEGGTVSAEVMPGKAVFYDEKKMRIHNG